MPHSGAVTLLFCTKSRAPRRMELNPEGSLGGLKGALNKEGPPRGAHYSLVTIEHCTMHSGPLAMLP